jgi:hypothetical protein
MENGERPTISATLADTFRRVNEALENPPAVQPDFAWLPAFEH